MYRQPIIIQVLSSGDHRIIRRRMIAMGFLTAAFLTLVILLAMQYVQDSKNMLVTGAVISVLFGNVILFFRNNMIDRHSENLCIDGGRCYTVTKSGITCDQSSVRLCYKREMLTIKSDNEKKQQPEKVFAFQVLDRQDWKAIKQLNARLGRHRRKPADLFLAGSVS